MTRALLIVAGVVLRAVALAVYFLKPTSSTRATPRRRERVVAGRRRCAPPATVERDVSADES